MNLIPLLAFAVVASVCVHEVGSTVREYLRQSTERARIRAGNRS